MYDIFLSYAKEDKQHAKTIALALEKEGFKVWWDIDIPTGKTFDSVIEEAIKNAKSVVVLWSKNSVISEWVHIEAAEGKKRNILVPVLIEDIEIPFAFRRRQTAKLINWNNRISNPQFKRLKRDIQLILKSEDYKRIDETEPPIKKNTSFLTSKFGIVSIFVVVIIIAFTSYYLITNKNKKNIINHEETPMDTLKTGSIPDNPILTETTVFNDWPIIMNETFTTESNYFPEVQYDSSSTYVKSYEVQRIFGKYRFNVSYYDRSGAYYKKAYNKNVVDFYAAVDFKFIKFKNPSYISAIIYFGNYGKGVYRLRVSGNYRISLYYYDGTNSSIIIGWKSIPDHFLNKNDFNRLAIKVDDKKIDIYMNNNKLINNFPEDNYLGGYIGLEVIGSNEEIVTVDFDNFELRLKPTK